jgi:YidC/Oxa1 family membrane protein insertase
MQQRNFVIFILLSLLILIGSLQLQAWLWPKPKQQAKPAAPAQADAKQKPQPEAKRLRVPKQVHEAGAGIPLGDDSSKLRVLLDPWGAGIISVTFNQFQQADSLGKPQVDANGNPVKLELVQREYNKRTPSNVLYHFAKEDDARPLSTLGQRDWDVVEPDQASPGESAVSFTTTVRDVRVTKTYRLGKDDYHIGLEVKVELVKGKETDKRPRTEWFRYQLGGPKGLRMEGEWYSNTLLDALFGRIDKNNKDNVKRDKDELRRISFRMGSDEVQKKDDMFIRYAAVVTQFFASAVVVDNQQADGTSQDFIDHARATVERAWLHGKIERIEGRTFVLDSTPEASLFGGRPPKETHSIGLPPGIELPDGVREGSQVAVNYSFDDQDQMLANEVLGPGQLNRLYFDDITVRLTTESFKLAPGKPVVHKYLLYNGPVKAALLGHLTGDEAVPPELVERYTDTLKLSTFTDYQSNSGFGEFAAKIGWTKVLIWVTNLMHGILWWIHRLIPNYGLCIILLTVLVRACMFPLSRKQTLAAQRMQEKMAKLKPEMDKLKEKYKNDTQALNQAKTELMLKHGMVNPLGSCWIALLQMPIFMGLYYALQESIHFRLASFAWIDNLAAPDMLLYWSQSIPLISSPSNYSSGWLSFLYLGPYFNLLPIIAVGFMIVQQSMMMPPAQDEQAAAQQKMMKYMTVFFGLMFYKVAAGLCIYFIVSSVWGFCERKLLPKKAPATGGPALPEPSRGRFAQWMLDRLNAAREGQSGAVTTTPPASNGATPSTPASDANRDKRKPKRPQRKPGPVTADGSNGTFRKLRAWWQQVLKEARKK